MNLPNKLTLARLFILPLIIALLYLPVPYGRYAALLLFLAGALSDMLDGRIARKNNESTFFGAFMDPTIDKITINSLFICLMDLGMIDFWMVILMLLREFLVQGIRNMAVSCGCILKSEFSGKLKAALQMATIFSGLLFFALGRADLYLIVWMMMALTLVFAYYALIEFLMKNRKFLSEAQEKRP